MPRKIAIDIGDTMTLSLKERAQGDGTFTYPEPFIFCLEVLFEMSVKFDGENLYVISRATGAARVEANHELLRRWGFCERLGVPPENILIYDGQKFGREKKAEYVIQRGITDVIDHSIQVLLEMPDSVQPFAFNPDQAELNKYADLLTSRRMYSVRSWPELRFYFDI